MPEVKIVKNIASFRREEVGPLAAVEPNVNLLAPEEVRKRAKFIPKSKDERTETDRKRERRNKKKKQKVMAKLEKKKEKNLNAEKQKKVSLKS